MKKIPIGAARTCPHCGETFPLVVFDSHVADCLSTGVPESDGTDDAAPLDPLALLAQDRQRVAALASSSSFLKPWETRFSTDLQCRLASEQALPLSTAQRSKVTEIEEAVARRRRPVVLHGGLPGHGKKA